MLTTAADVIGVACLTLFAFSIWPPAALLVFGLACLTASWGASR